MSYTIREKLIKALQERGCVLVPNARTEKYTVLTRPGVVSNDGRPTFWYVGTNGALRAGKTASSSTSQDNWKKRFLEDGKK